MTIGAIFFINLRGDIVISRYYRNKDVSRKTADTFRSQIAAGTVESLPVSHVGNTSYLYSRQGDLYVLCVTKKNTSPALVFQFIFQVVHTFKAYFKNKFDELTLRNHFVLIYELLDEMMDYGYPQITSIKLLQQVITMGKAGKFDAKEAKRSDMHVVDELTNKCDWRPKGANYHYRKNQVFLDVLENVNLLLSSTGEELKCDVNGRVVVKSHLSGMPKCSLHLNDKLFRSKLRSVSSGIDIDDVQFHRCVELEQFDVNRHITFIPPDGEFELMKYRTTCPKYPFKVTPHITQHGRTRVTYEIMIRGNFDDQARLAAEKIVIKIPTPPNTARVRISTLTMGRTKYNAQKNAIFWKISEMNGDGKAGNGHAKIKAEVIMMSSMSDKVWSRPPISVDFHIGMHTASGLHVRYLQVSEAYDTAKWVRYQTRAGNYNVRI